ncbi:hypothetical protein SORBI_3004G303900 [Sorghum bicolor]|jgi:hypothetical protein|uniref:Uncharacterized protein n=2 Tax=Sorghum bicolor TaxID=4558 RepID=A0A194YSB7_SORBI|nr:hypothetical protein SORBI_3004G303900 [Sorghum bicolor]
MKRCWDALLRLADSRARVATSHPTRAAARTPCSGIASLHAVASRSIVHMHCCARAAAGPPCSGTASHRQPSCTPPPALREPHLEYAHEPVPLRGFWSRSKKRRCWEDELERGCADRREGAIRGHTPLHLPLPVIEKDPLGPCRLRRRSHRGRAAATAVAGACAEAPGRASKGGLELEVRRRPVAATMMLPRHVRDREVRGQ